MKKIGLIVKESSEKVIKKNLKDADNLFVINYAKVPSPDLSTLRQTLRNVDAKLLMVQNSVARRALKNTVEGIDKAIDGPCGLIFGKEDPVETCKILYAFLRTHEQFKIESGFLGDRLLEKSDIEALAKLPSKDQLRAELVAIINSPLSRLTMVLKKNLNTITYYLEQRKDQIPAAEQAPKAEQAEQAPKAEQANKTAQTDKIEQTDKADKTKQADKTDKTDKTQ